MKNYGNLINCSLILCDFPAITIYTIPSHNDLWMIQRSVRDLFVCSAPKIHLATCSCLLTAKIYDIWEEFLLQTDLNTVRAPFLSKINSTVSSSFISTAFSVRLTVLNGYKIIGCELMMDFHLVLLDICSLKVKLNLVEDTLLGDSYCFEWGIPNIKYHQSCWVFKYSRECCFWNPRGAYLQSNWKLYL